MIKFQIQNLLRTLVVNLPHFDEMVVLPSYSLLVRICLQSCGDVDEKGWCSWLVIFIITYSFNWTSFSFTPSYSGLYHGGFCDLVFCRAVRLGFCLRNRTRYETGYSLKNLLAFQSEGAFAQAGAQGTYFRLMQGGWHYIISDRERPVFRVKIRQHSFTFCVHHAKIFFWKHYCLE